MVFQQLFFTIVEKQKKFFINNNKIAFVVYQISVYQPIFVKQCS